MRGMFVGCVAFAALAFARPCEAQQAQVDLRRDSAVRAGHAETSATSGLAPTPEMWLYEQERSRYDDTRLAVRRRAELKAQQRNDRIAAMAWYGMSNSRPTVSSTPWCGGYSTHWGSNSFDPLRWRPVAAPLIVARQVEGPY
jgi:hypothetical protein